jgi:hypothetical protein
MPPAGVSPSAGERREALERLSLAKKENDADLAKGDTSSSRVNERSKYVKADRHIVHDSNESKSSIQTKGTCMKINRNMIAKALLITFLAGCTGVVAAATTTRGTTRGTTRTCSTWSTHSRHTGNTPNVTCETGKSTTVNTGNGTGSQ